MVTQADVDAGSFTNTATVTGTPPVGPDVMAPDTVIVPAVQTPSILVTKTADQASFAAVGDILTYTFTVQNTGNVTLTGVTVSADLRVATVYYSVLGEGADREATGRGLASAGPFIRRGLAHKLRLKAVPEIRFVYDQSVDRGFRLLEILEGVQHGPEDPDR